MGFVAPEEVAFGPFRMSVRQRILSDARGPVSLSSRAFDVLQALIEHREAVVSKEDLMRQVWGNIVVEENNLHVQIAAIRKVLGAENRYIVTVPGKGYRFVGDLGSGLGGELVLDGVPGGGGEPEAPLTNLPTQMTALIGRQEELQSLCALFDSARLVTLVGPGGVGKTKLALEAARRLLPRFPTGCWLVELGPVSDPALTASAVAGVLKLEEMQGRPLVESLAIALRQRETLLVLDGCEHVAEAAGDMVAALLRACPRLRVLCSSQTPLEVEGEQVRRIAPFELPGAGAVLDAAAALELDAVRLFAERAGADGGRAVVTDATAMSVVEICRSLDGIPLAIELAAARVPLLGLEPVRSRIANRLALLGDDRRGVISRHRTLRAAIEWSHGLLPENDRKIIRRLSVFAGGFTLAAAQEVAQGDGFTEWDVVRGIGALVQRSLLNTGPDLVHPRHRMLESMRDFAQEQLVAAGEHAEAARRHALCFLALAERVEGLWETSGDAEWLALLAPELENVRVALGWALAAEGDATIGAALAAATARFWFEAGYFTEGRNWLGRALAQAPQDADPLVRIRLYRGLADLCMDAAAGEAAARQACALASATGDPILEGLCLRALGAALYKLGRYGEAEEAAVGAFARLDSTDCWHSFAVCVSDLGILRWVAGDHAEARRYNARAQARLKALGDGRRTAICLQYSGEIEFADGDVDAALRLAEESVALFRSVQSRFHLEIGLGNLAAYRLARGDATAAAAAAREALVIAREIEDHPGVVFALEYIALAAAGSGGIETAACLHGYIEAACRRLKLDRQLTEQVVHDRLVAALAGALDPEDLAALVAEGEVITGDAAEALALAA